MIHSELLWTAQLDIACGVVTQKDGTRLVIGYYHNFCDTDHDNDHGNDHDHDNRDFPRWLLHITGNYGGRVVYWDLTNNNGWLLFTPSIRIYEDIFFVYDPHRYIDLYDQLAPCELYTA